MGEGVARGSSKPTESHLDPPLEHRFHGKAARINPFHLILVGFPMHVGSISMELPILYSKGSQVETSKL